MSFIKHSTYSFLAVVFRALSAFAVNKLFAVYLGASGITLLAHFQNLIAIVTQIPNDGINRGLIKFLADGSLEGKEKSRIISAALWLTLGTAFLFILIFLFFNNFFFEAYRELYTSKGFFLLLLFSIILFLLQLFLVSLLLAAQQVKKYALTQIISAILVALAVYAGARYGDENIALLAFIGGQSLGLVFLVFSIPSQYKFKNISFLPDNKAVKKIANFIVMALSVLVFGRFLDFVVRDIAMQQFGLEETGLWQAVVKISDSILMVFIGTVGVVVYPKVSSLIYDVVKLRKYLYEILFITAAVVFIVLVCVYIFRAHLLVILFSRDFLPAGHLIIYQLPGDFLQMLSFIILYVVSAKAETFKFVALQVFSAMIYLLALFLLIERAEIIAFPLAHTIRYFLFFIAVYYFNRQLLFNERK
jgi:O-antigen/teichoic acid export membrane protein